MENIRFSELRCREVVNVCDGARLGYVSDIDIDPNCGRVCALIVPGKYRFFGLLGREDDRVIPWDRIETIGEDIVLVRCEVPIFRCHEKRFFGIKH